MNLDDSTSGLIKFPPSGSFRLPGELPRVLGWLVACGWSSAPGEPLLSARIFASSFVVRDREGPAAFSEVCTN
jgi:hypothetical protein